MIKKPVIGITSSYVKHNYYMEGVYVHHDYHRAIIEAGGIPIILPIAPPEVLDQYIGMCDGFILSGGEDVDPQFYNENPHPKLGFFYSERDESELYLTHGILKVGKPILGICRGMQLLNVALGGTLVQDVPSQLKEPIQHMQIINRDKSHHKIEIKKDSKLHQIFGVEELMVNSLHHQALDKVAEGLDITASASDKVVEAVELKDSKFVIGVQWHPESLAPKNEIMRKLFKELITTSF